MGGHSCAAEWDASRTGISGHIWRLGEQDGYASSVRRQPGPQWRNSRDPCCYPLSLQFTKTSAGDACNKIVLPVQVDASPVLQ